ncbi:MAG TPA: acyl-CoA dehydrogenase family protein [Acidimicrobiales bacterium]|nr:acyl-CoA dehydrogenase family protein [Acidimicrobiales bacterium]
MTKQLDQEAEAFLEVIKKWLVKDVEPYILELEHADAYPTAMVEQMREFGLFGATISQEFGGMGLNVSTYSKIVETISGVWMALTGVLNSHLMMAELLRRYGTDAQRESMLPLLASGEWRGGLALTEPDGGSDLQAIRMTAKRDGDHYVINGTKTWITNAKNGNCLALLVKTDTEANPRHKGMSLFIVQKSDGYEVPKQLSKMGYKSVDTVELVFDNVVVPADRLIGGVEGFGFLQTVGALELGRINVAARGVGVAEAALQASLAYARVRHTMGKPIGQHQAIQLKLADMACRAASARLLVDQAATAFDAGLRCDLEAGMAKLVATEAALSNATDAMRIHGAYGYSTEGHIERYYRDAPLLCIGEGTNEIQRLVIARSLLADE